MEFVILFFTAVGLSMDSFAVSITCGLMQQEIRFKNALKIAITMGFCQATMTFLGWFGGSQVRHLIESVDHWIAFGLLVFLGAKMLYESFSKDDEAECFDPLKWRVLIGLAIATSIDALAVGVGFAFIETNMPLLLSAVGIVTFLFVMTGILIGKKTGPHLGKRMEALGGIILIGIGFKIVIEHLFF